MSTEVAVGSLDTPIGVLWIACSERGVCKVIFPCEGGRGILDTGWHRISGAAS